MMNIADFDDVADQSLADLSCTECPYSDSGMVYTGHISDKLGDTVGSSNDADRNNTDDHIDESQVKFRTASDRKVPERHLDTPDGGYGWVVVSAAFWAGFVSDGISYNYAVLYVDMLERFNGSSGDTSLVGSLSFATYCFIGPVGGFLSDRYGCRLVCMIGGFLEAVGFLASMAASGLGLLYFTFGILVGVGGGLIFMSSLISVSEYFIRRKALATGIAACGGSLGTLAFGPLIRLLLDTYGWQGTLLLLSGLTFNCVACGALVRPLDSKKSPKNQSIEGIRENDKTALKTGKNDSFTLEQLLPSEQDMETIDVARRNSEATRKKSMKVRVYDSLSLVASALDVALLKHFWFMTSAASAILVCMGEVIPLVFLSKMAIDFGVDRHRASWMLSTVGLATAVGKFASGALAQVLSKRFANSNIVLFALFLSVAGLVTALGPMCKTFPTLLLLASVFGFGGSVTMSLCTVIAADLVGTDRIPYALGWQSLFSGVGYLVGSPIGGVLYDSTGSYVPLFLLAGASMVGAGLILLLNLCRRRHISAQSITVLVNTEVSSSRI